MKIIRFNEVEVQARPDGRTVRKLINHELGREFSSYQMLYVVHPANFREALHCHERSYEIFRFLDRANYWVNGKDYVFDEKDMVVLEPGDVHGATPIGNEVRIEVYQVPAITDDKKVFQK